MKVHSILFVCVMASARVALAQADWQQQLFQTTPTWFDRSVVYDIARDRIVMCANPNFRGPMETWEWDGTDWKQRAVGGFPQRFNHVLVYDTKRQRTVLWGGMTSTGGPIQYHSDTWAWDGTRWLQLTANGPMNPSFPSLACGAYDSDRDRIVVDGITEFGSGSLTYEFDGQTWSKRGPSAVPHSFSRMVYDARRRRCVVTGGVGRGGIDQVLEWDGQRWVVLSPTVRPSDRSFPAMAWDALRARTVLFGGLLGSNALDDTWEWDGTSWAQQNVTTRPKWASAMAFDTLRQRIVLCSGLLQWVYATPTPGSYQAFGVPCTGSLGPIALQPSPYDLPWLGDTLHMLVGPVPTTSGAALMLGDSTTSAGGIPLPFNLTGLGLSGCSLYVSPDFVLPPVSVGLEGATLDVPLPLIPSFAGRMFHTQALVLDPGANPAGLVTTNAGTAIAGIR